MLSIHNLTASVDNVTILNGVNLTIKAGEIHAIMGPNGSGKSTIGKIIAGHPAYTITGGEIFFEGRDLLTQTIDERAQAGIFLGFQDPVEIPGVNNLAFLQLIYNAKTKKNNQNTLDIIDFNNLLENKTKLINMNQDFLDRNVNEGFSGGERKRNEILQMSLLEPKLAILDELDSGLDIDTMKILGNEVNKLMRPDRALLIITHFPRILEIIHPTKVHVLRDGYIVKTGDIELAMQLEKYGYEWINDNVNNQSS